MSSPDIKTLSARIDSLVELADRLMAENRKLREREQALLGERDDLQKKNELAKAREGRPQDGRPQEGRPRERRPPAMQRLRSAA